MLVEFLISITPGSALMVVIFRFIKAKSQVTISRTETVRASARMEAAQEAAAIADRTARIALGQTTEALGIARTIESVDEKVDYIVSRIDGDSPVRATGRHARTLPNGNDRPAISSGDGILP
jgi:hypothetical protein